MFSKVEINNLIKQAQQMQDTMSKVQKEITALQVVGESGAGLVKITIDGAHNCCQVKLDVNLLKDDKKIIEDLITAAFNDAMRRIQEAKKEKLSSFTSEVNLPNDFK